MCSSGLRQHVHLEPAEKLRNPRPHKRDPHHDERPIRLQQAAKELRVREIDVGKQQPRHDFAAIDVEEPLAFAGEKRIAPRQDGQRNQPRGKRHQRHRHDDALRDAQRKPLGRIERLELEEQNQAERDDGHAGDDDRGPANRGKPGSARPHQANEGHAVNERRRRQAHQEANRPPEYLVRHGLDVHQGPTDLRGGNRSHDEGVHLNKAFPRLRRQQRDSRRECQGGERRGDPQLRFRIIQHDPESGENHDEAQRGIRRREPGQSALLIDVAPGRSQSQCRRAAEAAARSKRPP